jgi:uncharacterized protein with PQ loop repeat
MTDMLAVSAAGWGIVMALSPLLQVRRILARRSSADVSIAYLAVLGVGFLLWIAYGISLSNLALIVPNSTAFVIDMFTIGVALRFRQTRAAIR